MAEATPNKWKMGGVTGLAVDKDDNVCAEPPERSRVIEIEAESILRWRIAASMRRR